MILNSLQKPVPFTDRFRFFRESDQNRIEVVMPIK